MRWLVVGSHGMLGRDLVDRLASDGDQVTAVGRDEIDITDPAAVLVAFPGHDVVVNCAAFTAVDAAEEQEALAFAVNGVGAANLARAASRHRVRLVHISTDYVFEGVAATPYAEDAPTAPRSAYGRTKLAGEWAVRALAPDHLIVRTAWLYGAHGSCFPKMVARLARSGGPLAVVTDQVGQPTWTVDLVDLLVRLVRGGAPTGTYHGTSSGETSRFDFTRAIVESIGIDPAIVSATTSDTFVRPAPRPAYSVLGHDVLTKAGVSPIGDWRDRWKVAADVVVGASAVR